MGWDPAAAGRNDGSFSGDFSCILADDIFELLSSVDVSHLGCV